MDKNWFTRFWQSHIDPVYLDNMVRATVLFQSWFTGQDQSSYRSMLVKMHEQAIMGGYAGNTNSDGPVVPVGSDFRGVNKEAWRPLLKKEWFSKLRTEGENIFPLLRAEHLRKSHHLVIREKGYELHLPHEYWIPAFLFEMESIMGVLKYAFSPQLLADYIQYFVVCHPFERVNFSICMAQVNAILDHYGFRPMRHEWFDFNCFVYDFPCIETLFDRRLIRR